MQNGLEQNPLLRWIEMVTRAHAVYDHPIADSRGRILTEGRRAARGSWLLEELMELIKAEDLVDQVDAAIDFLYFCVGNLVECGRGDKVVSLMDELDEGKMLQNRVNFPYRVSFSQRISESVFQFMHSDTLRGQVDFTLDAMRIMLRFMRLMGVNPVGLFDIVHNAHMAKLWPDGKPRYDDFNKVVKPPTWEKPEPELARELDRRFQEWQKENGDDEIPF